MSKFITTKGHLVWCEKSQQYIAVSDEGYEYSGIVAEAGGVPTRETGSWAFYIDGTESGSLIIIAERVNPTLVTDVTYQWRQAIEETAGNKWNNPSLKLQYSHNSGAWTDVNGTSSVIQSDPTSGLVDGADTTDRITGTGTFQAWAGQDDVNGAVSDTIDTQGEYINVVFGFTIVSGDVANADTINLRMWDVINADTFDVNQFADPVITVNKAVTEHDLLADDAESASEVSSPVILQNHLFLPVNAESTSEVSLPGIGQNHLFLPVNAESTSEVSLPTLSESHSLLADDVESVSEVSVPAIGQAHVLTSVPAESASEVSLPSIGQVHALMADDAESSSELSIPVITQVHALLADDVESVSELSAPALVENGGTVDDLLADNVESTSEVSIPDVGQEHALLADDVQSTSDVSLPAVGQVHALLANDAESISEVSTPALTENTADHNLLADDAESASEVSTPVLAQVHSLIADDVESSSEVSVPSVSQSHSLLANDVESGSEVSFPVLTEVSSVNDLLADDIESTSEVSIPVLAQVHVLFANDVETASEVSAPVIDGVILEEPEEATVLIESYNVEIEHFVGGVNIDFVSVSYEICYKLSTIDVDIGDKAIVVDHVKFGFYTEIINYTIVDNVIYLPLSQQVLYSFDLMQTMIAPTNKSLPEFNTTRF